MADKFKIGLKERVNTTRTFGVGKTYDTGATSLGATTQADDPMFIKGAQKVERTMDKAFEGDEPIQATDISN